MEVSENDSSSGRNIMQNAVVSGPADPNLPEIDEPQDAEIVILERSEAKLKGIPLFTAHWHLFIPTVVIAVMYSFAWLGLALLGRMDTGIARMFVVVMAVGVPLLAVHAFLRFQTIRLQISDEHVLCHQGWPKDMPIELAPELITQTVVKRGLSGRLFGGGTLVLHLSTGSDVVIADLGDPDKAKAAIEALMRSDKTSGSD